MPVILVVDDEESVLTMFNDVLSDEGYNVLLASSGKAALAHLEQTTPDLLLCDHLMRYMSGAELCSHIQRDPRHAALIVVMMSAGSPAAIPASCRHDAYLQKPFMLDFLLDLVATLLSK